MEIKTIKYIYPDDTYCFRALHTTHAVFRDEEGKLVARAKFRDEEGKLVARAKKD